MHGKGVPSLDMHQPAPSRVEAPAGLCKRARRRSTSWPPSSILNGPYAGQTSELGGDPDIESESVYVADVSGGDLLASEVQAWSKGESSLAACGNMQQAS